jgi:hypothetical protein
VTFVDRIERKVTIAVGVVVMSLSNQLI